MTKTTIHKSLNFFIRQLFCLVLIFNVAGKTMVLDILHESMDLFELCDSGSEEKELDCKEKEIEDYDEEKKFFSDSILNFKHANETKGAHYYTYNMSLEIHDSIVLPPPEALA